MERLGYYNGNFGPLEEMQIPMNDRVSYFGDGVYDAGPCKNYVIFALDEHVDRFFRSMEGMKIVPPCTKQELKDTLNDLVKKLDSGDQFVYYQVTRGTGLRNHVFSEGKSNLWITLVPKKLPDFNIPIKLITYEDKRYYYCNFKTLNLIPNVLASEEAKQHGCQEAVFVRPGGRVTECAHSNVHILQNGKLKTAPTDEYILPGIARAHLIKACNALSIPVDETPFTVDELFDADEVIVTSSSNLCCAANEIDGKTVGGRDEAHLSAIRDWLLDELLTATNSK